MKIPRLGVMILISLSMASGVFAVDLKNRSTSSTGQFVIYCDDRDVRARIASFVEETKGRVLGLLRERDDWDYPVVMTVDRVASDKEKAGVFLRLIQTVGGGKVEMTVRVGDDLSSIFLQKHVIRAVLLELAYRDRAIPNGKPVLEPPWWLVEGMIESFRRRDGQLNADVFKDITDSSGLPSLQKLVTQPPLVIRGKVSVRNRAGALCLLEALLSLPNGPENLARLVKEWPEVGMDQMGALARHFPVLAESEKSLAKWWSLQFARFANSERWQGLTLEATDKELSDALKLQIVIDKKGTSQTYSIADFAKFESLPGAIQSLRASQVRLIALSTKSNPLFRPVIGDYERIVSSLIAGKTKEVAQKIAETEIYRKSLVERMAMIKDYLNWYEATNPQAVEGVFDDLIREIDASLPPPLPPVDPRISKYLDSFEKEFEPVKPDGLIPANGTPNQ
jgi:hypothetical protein